MITLIAPEDKNSMRGAGVIYKNKTFITHTTLSHHISALATINLWQTFFLVAIFGAFLFGLIFATQFTAIIFIAILSTIYFTDVFFTLFVVLKSLHFPPELTFDANQLTHLPTNSLPVYSILCPLYRESSVLPQFVAAIDKLDYPKNKLDVLLLLEEDDQETIIAASNMPLPDYFRVIVVPDSLPKTKPKACNYGLSHAIGEYVVIYDAEDIPDPLQLKKAVLGFKNSPEKVVCLQAKLNYYNPHKNFLTRLFTAEYSLWFDVVLPGFQSIDTMIPLGGTSNHFKTQALKDLQGWDPFNVTEDADLGIRLFKAGYKTAIIDSTTLEEANSRTGNWIRQRSRWIKGYFQTYLVHMRDPFHFAKTHGVHALIFQLVIGARTTFMLINPILWVMTLLYFAAYHYFGPAIEALYPAPVFYMAVISLIFGNFIYLYNYMIGCARRGHWNLIKFIFFMPIYWLFVSIAAGLAAWQLVTKPHFWEKTVHGFHLGAAPEKKDIYKVSPEQLGGLGLVAAALVANFFNFLYNAYLSRAVSTEDFGLVSLFGSLLFLTQMPIGTLSSTFTYRSSYLFGKYETLVKKYWSVTRRRVFKLSLIASTLWILLTPFLKNFFKSDTLFPFIIFAPIWVIGTLSAIDQGFLNSGQKFWLLAGLVMLDSVTKFVLSVFIVHFGFDEFVYAAVPGSMVVSFLVGYLVASRIKTKPVEVDETILKYFPKRFFANSIFSRLSTIAFLSLDLILAKHFLSPEAAGSYSYLSLIGKMVFLIGSLFAQFILPIVSREEGAGRETRKVFNKFLVLIILADLAAFAVFGLAGSFTAPLLWGTKVISIIPLLPMYTLGMVFFSVSSAMISYHQIHHRSIFPVAALFLAAIQTAFIVFVHNSVATIATIVAISGFASYAIVFLLDFFYDPIMIILRNAWDFVGLFLPFSAKMEPSPQPGKLRILVFNWRDLRHQWAGGAEVYIHELSKRWVAMGHTVTVFCGNDGHASRYETIDGVNVIRRGGFYFVYFWAFLYYIFRLYNKFDVIIDGENGIPFFTPLYSSKKIFLLIHHVHQDVFRVNFQPPVSWIGAFLEKRVMPFVYRHTQVITVSPSSKIDILDHELTKIEPVVIYNGVDLAKLQPGVKNKNPLVVYLGRLRTHKSIDVFIHVAKKVLETLPQAEFIIAGDGQQKGMLMDLAAKLNLQDKVKFLGKISDNEKLSLLQKAWVFVNPSLMEGWAITTIEANACGTPVVASNVAGLRDAVWNPHSGLLVPYGDVDAFSKEISKLITNTKLRHQMEKDSIIWAKRFNWDKSADEAINLMLPKYDKN